MNSTQNRTKDFLVLFYEQEKGTCDVKLIILQQIFEFDDKTVHLQKDRNLLLGSASRAEHCTNTRETNSVARKRCHY